MYPIQEFDQARPTHELDFMTSYSPVTDTDLARARNDPGFRQKLLSESLESLLTVLRKARNAAPSGRPIADAKQMREGVELAVRLAELIQGPKDRVRKR